MDKEIKQYFAIGELVCPHVAQKWGDRAWEFFDPRLLDVLLYVRRGLGRPIVVNTWEGDAIRTYTQRGLRCNMCELVRSKSHVYMSAHMQGMAIDFSVQGLDAETVRRWLRQFAQDLPHPIRMERGVSWVHIDVRTPVDSTAMITEFDG